jgi:hypothetical protein
MRTLRLAVFAALLVVASWVAVLGAAAHRDPCHWSHTCPSDHHTYPWHGLWCTSYPDERLPSDTKVVVVQGRTYWCHGSMSGGDTSARSGSCGVERWTVKTLQDRPRLLSAVRTTVRFLVTRRAPADLPSTRLPFERHIFTVTAAVVLVRPEADSDLHLLLRAGGNEMIAEAPSPACDSKATPLRRRQMSSARAAASICARAVVTGVAFFDFDHGQTGVAPNAIELHPILGFRCLG